MLAKGAIQAISQTQHLSAPDSHTSEVTAAGTGLHNVIPMNGLLQEARIRRGRPTPFYLDSKTTVFVATSDTAAKKSAWIMRRVEVLKEGVKLEEMMPFHLPERLMCADAFTKYLVYSVWRKHMDYVTNATAHGLTFVQ